MTVSKPAAALVLTTLLFPGARAVHAEQGGTPSVSRPPQSSAAASPNPHASRFRPIQGNDAAFGHYVVTFAEGIPEAEAAPIAEELARRYGGRLEAFAATGFHGFAIVMRPTQARLLSADARVVLVEEQGDRDTRSAEMPQAASHSIDSHTPDAQPRARAPIITGGEERARPVVPQRRGSPGTAGPNATNTSTAVPRKPSSSATGAPVGQDTGSVWTTGAYLYDAAGNVTGIGADYFYYDQVSRLVKGTAGANHDQAYTYDTFGNLTSIATGGDAANALLPGVDPQTNRISQNLPQHFSAVYDGAGNVVADSNGASFSYDALRATRESTVDNAHSVYLYGPGGQRIATVMLVGGSPAAARYTVRDPAGRVLREIDRVIATSEWSWREDYVYAGTSLLVAEVAAAGSAEHFFPDHLGSPRLITGSGGARISSHTYYPFGQEATDAGQDDEVMKFTGQERDRPSLDYFHARYTNPFVGRFLSPDPILGDAGEPQSWNRYAYTRDNPISRTDPTGLADSACQGKGNSGSQCDNQLLSKTPSEKSGQERRTNGPANEEEEVPPVRASFTIGASTREGPVGAGGEVSGSIEPAGSGYNTSVRAKGEVSAGGVNASHEEGVTYEHRKNEPTKYKIGVKKETQNPRDIHIRSRLEFKWDLDIIIPRQRLEDAFLEALTPEFVALQRFFNDRVFMPQVGYAQAQGH